MKTQTDNKICGNCGQPKENHHVFPKLCVEYSSQSQEISEEQSKEPARVSPDNTSQTKRKARIIRYWQVVDENSSTIDDAQNYKTALKIKKDYENENQ